MKVIGAGFGRTGTLSLKHALETLGFAPCYHMVEVHENRDYIDLWQAVADGHPVPWETIFGAYQATVDIPGCLYYEALMAAYPDAKVLLSTRDPEKWYESMKATVYQVTLLPPWMAWIPGFGGFIRLVKSLVWHGFFQGRFDDRAFAIAQFNQHNERVKQTVPPERLLVYSVREGWAPLCEFLEVPVPDQPFPHLNDRAELQQLFQGMRLLGWAGPPLVITFCLWVMKQLLGRR